jgi:hypothetical protein
VGRSRLMAGPEPQSDGRGISGDESQSVPSAKVTVGFGAGDEPVIQGRDGGRCQLAPGLGEGLLGDLAGKLGLLLQVGKKLVQFGLNALAQAGQQDRDQRG